jgi:beta-phosphoglucomutase
LNKFKPTEGSLRLQNGNMDKKMNKHNFQACVFDFDGVIIDSEPLHAQAKQAALDNFQIEYPSTLFTDTKGSTDKMFFEFVANNLARAGSTAEEMDAYKRQVYLKLFEHVPLVTGIQEFLPFARQTFKKLGVATSATIRDFSLAARKYELLPWFDVIVTSEDTMWHKPDPEPYLKAMAMLGVSACQTLVIEDSPNGIQSAKSANCVVVAVTTAFEPNELHLAGADMVVASFAELKQALEIAPPNKAFASPPSSRQVDCA